MNRTTVKRGKWAIVPVAYRTDMFLPYAHPRVLIDSGGLKLYITAPVRSIPPDRIVLRTPGIPWISRRVILLPLYVCGSISSLIVLLNLEGILLLLHYSTILNQYRKYS